MILAIIVASGISMVIPSFGTSNPDTWTFMVYLDADNDLEIYGIHDFFEMSAVGSTSYVNIVVQMDRTPGYDSSYGNWETCKRFLITYGMQPTPANAIADIGEVNMGDPSTLVDFVSWSVANYPANHYVLDLWDHGGDWYGVCWDYSNFYDNIDMIELGSALSQIQTDNSGLVLDILGFDTCSGGSIEVAYQVYPYAHYMIASEHYIPDEGWNYTGPLLELTSDPNITPARLGDHILHYYSRFYESLKNTSEWYMLNESYTLSIVDLSVTASLVAEIDNLGNLLFNNLDYWVNHIAIARESTEAYLGVWSEDVVDLHHFAENLGFILPNGTIQQLSAAIIQDIETMVLNKTQGTNPENHMVTVDHHNGMSLYFPKEGVDYDSYYNGSIGLCSFSIDTSWDDFLESYLNMLQYGYPTVMHTSPVGTNASMFSTVEIWFSEPMDNDTLASAFSIFPSVDGNLFWNASENKLTFVPSSSLTPGENYSINISIDALDQQAVHLQRNYTWQFGVSGPIPEFNDLIIPVLALIGLVLLIACHRRKS